MSKKEESPQDVIDSYKKRQQVLPFAIGGGAVILVLVGVIILIVSLSGGKGLFAPAATQTPTSTSTFTPSPTIPSATPSSTMTVTQTPTTTVTPTPNGPIEYIVQEGDTCWDLALKYNVDFPVLMAINSFTDSCPISPGDKIFIPAPDQTLPTSTDIPTGIAKGTVIEYTIQFGDTLALIAAKYSSSVDVIVADNNIKDVNAIVAGTKIKVRVNIATATKTLAPTSTTGVIKATATSNVISAASATLAPTATITPTK